MEMNNTMWLITGEGASAGDGSIPTVHAVYALPDDFTEPAPAFTFAHLDAATVLHTGLLRG